VPVHSNILECILHCSLAQCPWQMNAFTAMGPDAAMWPFASCFGHVLVIATQTPFESYVWVCVFAVCKMT